MRWGKVDSLIEHCVEVARKPSRIALLGGVVVFDRLVGKEEREHRSHSVQSQTKSKLLQIVQNSSFKERRILLELFVNGS